MAADQINMYTLSWSRTLRLQPSPDMSKNRYLKSQGEVAGLYREMCGDGWVSHRPWWQLCALMCLHKRKHTRLKMEKWACANTCSLQKKKIYFHVAVPYDLVCLPELITGESSSGNEKQTWPSDCWSQHESSQLSGRERGKGGWYCKNEQTELSTDSNVNCSGLHNLRLMRKQRQIKSPSFYPCWLGSTGALFIKKASEATL